MSQKPTNHIIRTPRDQRLDYLEARLATAESQLKDLMARAAAMWTYLELVEEEQRVTPGMLSAKQIRDANPKRESPGTDWVGTWRGT